MRRGNPGEPIEQPFAARELGDQHHPGQEEVDVGALGDAGPGVGDRKQAEGNERNCAGDGPQCFRQSPRPQDHSCYAECDDDPGRNLRLAQVVVLAAMRI
jgi:hypothetical protein